MNKLQQAITRAKIALDGDSNDEEHDALFGLLEALEDKSRHEIEKTPLLYQGKNKYDYQIEAAVEENSVESGAGYREVRVNIYRPRGGCIADIFIGLEDDEPRVLVTANGEGDADHCIAVYPARTVRKAVEVDSRGVD